MQPCEVCGGMGIDAAGYCTNCRTYRGIPGQAPYPGYPQPQQQQPYPQTGYGQQPGYPVSVPPGYGAPTSGPGYGAPASGAGYGAPTSGPGYGAPVPPTPPKQRSSFTVPLIALSATLVVVVIAIVAVVIVRSGDDDGDGDGNTPAVAIDQCVVGTWEVTDYSEDVSVPNVGPVKFTDSGKGATVKFGPDGKGVQDFGSGTNFQGTVQGVRVTLTIQGTVRYDYSTNKNTVSYDNLVSDGKATVSAPGVGSQSEDFKGSSDPSKYTCSGDSMTMSTTLYTAEMKRTSKSV